MDKKSFFSFERMITPIIIKFVFYIGLIATGLAGLVFFFSTAFGGWSYKDFPQILGGILWGIIGGALIIALGALAVRVYAELLILFFRINETLSDIKALLQEK